MASGRIKELERIVDERDIIANPDIAPARLSDPANRKFGNDTPPRS